MDNIVSFFDPASVALIGSTSRKGSVGNSILKNLLLGSDKRTVYPVNPGRKEIFNLKCYPSVSSLPGAPELAVIAIPADKVTDVVTEAGQVGVKAVIIVSAGFKEIGAEGERREAQIAEIAGKYNIRIMGPNCMGIIRPSSNLNTTFIRNMPAPGNVAFLSQSGALGAGILDWAISKNIGLSAFVSLGSMLDVDFGDLIDFFGEDRKTRSIVIYPESIGDIRKFASAARGFARSKPIIALKPGKSPESAKAAMSHTGAMVSEDLYYDALFRRTGVVRVEEIKDLFNCASILNSAHLPKGPNLAIVANGGGPAVVATDNLIIRGGRLAGLAESTIGALNDILPANWSKSNPVDILEDANLEKFSKALNVVVKDPGVNGVLVIYTPQGGATAVELARAVIAEAKKTSKPILTAMIGDGEVARARKLFYQENIPTYEFPEDAVKTYLYMYQYAQNLEMLYQMPEEAPLDIGVPNQHLKILIHKAMAEGRKMLSGEDSVKFLRTYNIASARLGDGKGGIASVARSADEAAKIASDVGFPVVMKIDSPDIAHKYDVDGVVLDIDSVDAVRDAFDRIMKNVARHQPDAVIEGVSIHRMIKDYDYQLIVGSKKDPIFGPLIVFGMGGTEAEYYKDIAVCLPSLNRVLARRLLEQTRVFHLLANGYRGKPPADLAALEDVLIRLSNMVVDFPEIKEIDINPLVIKGSTAIALDERIILDENARISENHDYSHLIISPYPSKYIHTWRCKDGREVLIRPVRPEDERLNKELLENLSEESLRFRFFHVMKEITHDMLTRFCNIDYEREMAVVVEHNAGGKKEFAGVGRLIIEPGGNTGEFAVVVAEDFQGQGLGLKLCDFLIGIAREKGLKSIYAVVLNENIKMVNMARRLNFDIQPYDSSESKLVLEL